MGVIHNLELATKSPSDYGFNLNLACFGMSSANCWTATPNFKTTPWAAKIWTYPEQLKAYTQLKLLSLFPIPEPVATGNPFSTEVAFSTWWHAQLKVRSHTEPGH